MRNLIALSALLALTLYTPVAVASGGTMDEKEMMEMANLVAYGTIIEVLCDGEPEYDGSKTITRYLATLVIDSVEKGDETLESVTLPFATIVYDPGASRPKCDWTPAYHVGNKGLYYLTTGVNVGLYTLIHADGFVADEDSVSEPWPACGAEQADASTSEDIDEQTDDATPVGPTADSAGVDPTEDDTGSDPSEDAAGAPRPMDATAGADIGETSGGETSGGETSGGENSGGETSGGENSGGENSGGENSGDSQGSDSATSGGSGCANGHAPGQLPLLLLSLGALFVLRRGRRPSSSAR